MFGGSVDYWILRGLTHARNATSEEELDHCAGIESPST
jgi:hypothetical protein